MDQILQKGIEAHKAGHVQEADRLYTTILKTQSKHPDANHNMGVLAVGVGKVEQALPFFKTALEANPATAQFWLSYIDALIKLNKFIDAKAVLTQARSKGAKGGGFDQLEQRLNENSEQPLKIGELAPEAHHDKPNILDSLKLDQAITLAKKKAKDGSLEEAKRIYQDILIKFPKNKRASAGLKGFAGKTVGKSSKVQDAPKAELQSLMALYNKGQLPLVVEKAKALTNQYPETYAVWNLMGASAAKIGQLDQAIFAFKRALAIRPDNADAYNNKGLVLKKQGKLEEAIETYNKALAIKPDHADIYNNKGIVLQDQGKLEEAIEAYNKAFAIKPDHADAYNNMGNALYEQGKLEDAIKAFTKTLSIKPDHADAYNNMGNALYEQGKLEDSIKSFTKTISIKPDHTEAWNNIIFPLQAVKSRVSSEEELVFYYPGDTGSNYYQIAKSYLNFKINLGGTDAERSLSGSLNALSKANYSIIKKPEHSEEPTNSQMELTNKVIALVHFGRSGTGLLHSLIDGHPDVSTLPSIYLSEHFNHLTWEKIISGGWSKMVDNFMAIYDVLFDAASPVLTQTKGNQLIGNIGLLEGMTNIGDQRDEVLSVERTLFSAELKRLMNCYNQLDSLLFFKLVHRAYDRAIGDMHEKHLIFYHIHNPGISAQLNFVRSVPEANWVMMVREPVQSCESWLKPTIEKNDYTRGTTKIRSMLFEIDNIIYHNQNSVGVRLEDLKERPRQTIPALCNWMGIEETESLYAMTAQGKKWWGDPTSPDFAQDGMNPFGKTSINRKLGSVFSESDQYILRTLFYPFSVRFGYVEENAEQFDIDLKTIRPMLDEMFDFEKTIAEQTGIDQEQFMESGSYLYLRSSLIERWDILKEYGTYPNMIKPLKI